MRRLSRALLVIETAPLREEVAKLLHERWGTKAMVASGEREARRRLDDTPDLLILETPLAEGEALQVARAASQLHPSPLQIAIGGDVRAEEAFRLGQEGVRAYVTRPFAMEELASRIEEARRQAPVLDPQLKGLVGHRALRAVQSDVRELMLREAMALAGSRGGAARLLRVSRQAVQQAVREMPSTPGAPELVQPVPVTARSGRAFAR